MALSTGTRLGGYEILGALGAGGMGEVYRARDAKLNREVALKVLPESLAGDPDRLARFRREAQVLAALNHPNIAHIHGFEDSGTTHALVMELVEGPTLADRIAQGPIPLDEALPIARQIADALESAHEQGIIHRDLKPANIKVRPDGTVKVLDFGLAKAVDPVSTSGVNVMNSPTLSNHATQAGIILGTAAYMSPEQAAGKAVDTRSDLWAFGVVLLEMLTGRHVFPGETVSHVLAAVLKSEPDWTTLPADTPTPIRRVLRRCLEKDRRRRIADASDARLELDEVGSSGSLEGGFAVSAVPTATVPAWRRALPWMLAGILGLALVAALLMWSPWGATSEARLLKLSIVPPEGTTFHTMAVSPDGRMLAFTATDASGKVSLWVRALDSLTAHMFPSTEGAAYPFWSPDSRYIGYSAHDALRKVAVSGGPAQTICSQDGSRGATWGRSGVILFTAGTSSPLLQVSAAGGEAAPVTSFDASRGDLSHRWPSFLPDGRHYVYTVRGGQRDVPGIYVGSLDSTAGTRVTGDVSNAAYAESTTGVGYLLFARGRSLLAQPFDVDHLRLTGDPLVIDDNVWYSAGWALASFSISQTGVLVFDSASRGRDAELAWFDRTGARRGAVGRFAGRKFSLSPNGTRVVLDGLDGQTLKMNLWMADLGRGIRTRFTPGAERPQESPVWSPDGTRIAFVSENAIFERSADGSGEDSLLLKADSPIAVQDWSRDGSFLLYQQTDPKTRGDLWVLPMSAHADKTAFQVVRSQFDEASGAFSPDGKWIAFDSADDSGTREVFVQACSRSGSSGRWQVSKGGGLHPQWRADGKELFYLASDLSKLMSVSVTSGPSFDAGPPAAVFAGSFDTGINPQFIVTPDGQRFLISVPMSAEGSAPPTVILNWPAGLKK
jgi:Tol biopolymer transport system component